MVFERRLWFCAAIVLSMGGAPALAGTIQVTIDRLAFTPADITARVGDTIEWVNNDPIAHTATVKGKWEVMIPPKAKVTQRVGTVETVDFFCRFHPNMKGRLTVEGQ